MAVAQIADLKQYCQCLARRAKAASAELARVRGEQKNAWLRTSAESLRQEAREVLAANAIDLEAAPGYGLSAAQIDRLRLTEKGIESVAHALEEIALLPDPVGELIESSVRP